ncbi:MAG: dihydrolipoyl dehydrogenase [SAR324 cluster bacterium]|nr:dihydrolipoyl dehydrogenase [SAR324 cluster bacterium]
MKNIKTNTLIIGGGPAGYPAAIRLGQLKVPTILVEKSSLGGTCLNVGCIPSKALIGIAAKYNFLSTEAKKVGISAEKPKINWSDTITWKDKLVNKLTSGVKTLLKANNVTQINGHCKILTKNLCQVDDGQKIEFENLIIATGSKTIELPGFEFNSSEVLNSTDLLSLKKLPKSMIIMGGGIIGMEIGTIYASLGCQVTIVEMQERILGMYDEDAVKIVQKSFESLGGAVLTDTKALSWRKVGKGIELKVNTKGEKDALKADKLAVMVGREANFDGLNLSVLPIELAHNRVVVNDQMQTSLPNIYAVGDIVTGPMLAHKATLEGVLAAEVIGGHKVSRADVKVIPDVVYTKPEIAKVGYSESQARDKGIEVTIGKFPLAALGIAASALEDKGYVKYIAEKSTNRIVGATIVSYRAADMISEATLAIEMGAHLEDIALSVHPHPSFGEAHMEAALAGLKQAIHIVN